jgi:hypothetical protein
MHPVDACQSGIFILLVELAPGVRRVAPTRARCGQIIDARHLQRWLSAFGADRFGFAVPANPL